MNQDLLDKSRYIAMILRHSPEDAGIKLDKNGWTDLSIMLERCKLKGYDIDYQTLLTIVNTNNKKRFTISDDGKQIRAAQGHSTPEVQMQMKTAVPPVVLYHGTATKYVDSIKKKGLISKGRHHVHLSADTKTAKAVGKRHGDPVIFKVDTKQMLTDGYKFYLSDNHVWLTNDVPNKYLTLLESTNYDNSPSLSC